MSELSDRVAKVVSDHREAAAGCTCGARWVPLRDSREALTRFVTHVAEAVVREALGSGDGDANAAILTPMLVELSRMMEPIKDYAKGYRAALVREGWSEAAAEAMAVQVHNSLIESAFRAPA